MNQMSRTLTGIILILAGLGLVVAAPFAHFLTLICGLPLFVIGLFILFNKNEDMIERRKDIKRQRNKE